MNALVRDEVGLIRAISVKERSSSQCKQRFHDIQVTAGAVFNDIKALTVDMKHVEKFITEISHAAKDRATSAKLYSLLPSAEEWNRVKKFQRILQTLHDRPSMSEFARVLDGATSNDQYEYFEAGLQSGLDKISEYYDKTGDNDVPSLKPSYMILIL
ncbi:uncharacterized protein LAESUDRAFT_713157 [Laetiporus sulphureus 93-53]|uniref:Uncharacterized protein n=1 Tax=Laetiporus sulphureus 93-53 TaxID=1314785 RepID=A0A165F320_9APHY|nr:uncharacterized protein LAESUDRAFT_713157 [Laetiporus sulphureus 93-53]KZT08271.1 hypothetical protein LAESUDRAFT_713157 [Laetiporus sulphureus 93-53]